jgi:PKD repeat protein
LDKVNSVTFQPGDQILLAADSVWHDQQLYPKGSGTVGNPIVVDMYGTGAKPLINTNHVYHNTLGGEPCSSAVLLYDQDYWEISNLELTNYLEGVDGTYLNGVYVVAEETGRAHNHIHLRNLDIHHVNGARGRGTGRDKGKGNGGILVDVLGDGVAGTKFDDVLVEGCYIYDIGWTAIKTWSDQGRYGNHTPWTPHTNVVIRDNVVDSSMGDGIVPGMCAGPLVEYNVASNCHLSPVDAYVAIWNWECDDTIIQYNEAYLTHETHDGQGFDIDDYTKRTILQYNYSHDNEGGFLLMISMPNMRNKGATCDDNVIRYNISQNDGDEVIRASGSCFHADFYNNVFYIPADGSAVIAVRIEKSDDIHFYNNIWDVRNGCEFEHMGLSDREYFTHNIINANCYDIEQFKSDWPQNYYDVDPGLVAIGTGGTGRDTCGGYMIAGPASFAIDKGIWSDDSELMGLAGHPGPIGADHGSNDYFDNALPYPSGTPDCGAHEHAGVPQPPVADFTGNPTNGNAPLTVYFTDLSSNNPTSWDWTFGDGGTSQAQDPSHEYTSASDYTVSLEACNSAGCDTETKPNYISVTEGQPPVADFVGDPLSGNAPLTVYFTDLSSNDPTSWDWTFGDGGTSQAQGPSHEYTGEGQYTVSLTAANAYGEDTETKPNYITVTSGEGGDYYPGSYEIDVGTYVSGDLSDLQASDDSYLVVDSAKQTGKQSTYIFYTFDTGLSSLSSLTITSESHPSLAPQRERIRVWDYGSGSWTGVIGDHWLNGTSDETTVTPVPDPANYISAGGQVKIRIRTGDAGGAAWTHSIDLVKITAAP